ncbi:hypothetical protein E4U15_004642 [Claviceps sp. LM218 group G6]|nr:hypothetical protein E4U15_004642 [Claviceps sp. LM218 group G6]
MVKISVLSNTSNFHKLFTWLTLLTLGFTVVLKEEKTRLREYDEDVARKTARGPWEHLPNRPVYGQRPYYSW